MSFKSADGKNNNSKFRANRRDRESAVKDGMESAKPKGNRAEANAIEAKGTKGPAMDTGAGDDGGPVNAQGAATPQAKAKEVHITHGPEGSHVHAVMDNNPANDQHSDHASPEEAHFHGATVAGVAAGGENPDGQYPMKHKHPAAENPPDADDYDVEPL